MSIQRTALGLTLAAAATVTLSVRADQPVNLNVEMGLWEVTANAQTTGAALPPDMQQRLQSLPPEQREKIMAAMQGAMADARRGHVFRKCITRERLAQGFDRDDSSQCKSSLVRNTGSDFEYRKICKSDDGSSHTEDAVFHMTDRHHVTGTVDVVASQGGHAMTIHQVIDGKWLASSCGSVKDIEQVR